MSWSFLLVVCDLSAQTDDAKSSLRGRQFKGHSLMLLSSFSWYEKLLKNRWKSGFERSVLWPLQPSLALPKRKSVFVFEFLS